MEINRVLAGVAVRDMEDAKRWYGSFFDRSPDAEPMPSLADWYTPGGTLQVVLDEQRAGGSLVTVEVEDARAALTELAARGGPQVELDDTTSDKVLFATLVDPDGNGVTVVQTR
jgi:predicted enzyme related to lactoylglutathione lyase